MVLSKPSNYFPAHFVDLTKDYQQLGVTKLHAKIYHEFYQLHYIALAEGAVLETLLTQVIAQLLQDNPTVNRQSVHYVIYGHTSLTKQPFHHNVLSAAARRNQLTQAVCFSFNLNKCASGIEALSRIEQLFLFDTTCQDIILVTGDQHFTLQQRVLKNASIGGDGFSSVFISRYPKQGHDLKVIATHKHVYPEYYQGAWLEREKANAFEENFQWMMARALSDVIQKASLNVEQIKMILPHNVNTPIWRKIADELRIDSKKIYSDNMPKYGHCSTADFLINLASVYEQLKEQDYIAAACVGFGLSFVTVLLQKVPCVNQEESHEN